MQDKNILIGLSVVAIIICVGIFAYGRNGGNLWGSPMAASARNVVPFTPLAQGEQSAIKTRVNYRITSEAQLSELWALLEASSTPPAVDFNTHEVLAVFAGDASSPFIDIAKIEDSHERMVSITLAKPEGSCANAGPASPYELVAVPATTLPLTHQDQVAAATCAN